MGRPFLVAVLLLLLLLLLISSSSLGLATRAIENGEQGQHPAVLSEDHAAGESRDMIGLDYVDAGPNTNPKAGYPFNPTPPPQD